MAKDFADATPLKARRSEPGAFHQPELHLGSLVAVLDAEHRELPSASVPLPGSRRMVSFHALTPLCSGALPNVSGNCHYELMTELAYMVREDWAQHGTTMVPQSAVIREWIGESPYLFAVADAKKFQTDRAADLEAAEFIAPDASTRKVFSIAELGSLARQDKVLDHAIVILHPDEQQDLDALAEAVKHDALGKVFVMIWSPYDVVHNWLDGLGALNLHTGEPLPAPDPVMVEAGRSMVSEQYNGLSSGHGKDAVVQLVRAFTAAGYPLDVDAWLRAYFAAGGTFRHGGSIAKLVGEMKKGVQHRVKTRYVSDIIEVLRDRAAAKA
jgi:hypothetical protein